MRKMSYYLHQNRYFLLFILLFAYVQSVYSRISVRPEINAYIFTPEAALASLLSAGILFFILLSLIRNQKESEALRANVLLKIFGIALLIYMVIMQCVAFLTALGFGKIEQNFNRHTLLLSLLSDFLNGFIYGSFFLSYYYFLRQRRHQQKLAEYHKALAESQVNRLKQQLNPHFLFNNLNVLDQLIEEDKNKASHFLNEFAELYRYVLQVSEDELVSLQKELEFARHYFSLIQSKYGNAYELYIENKEISGFVVPLTLQVLIENAVQHNLGTLEAPIQIRVHLDQDIVVSNRLKPKRYPKTTSGRALKNLREQYRILTETPIDIKQSDQEFTVRIPIISAKRS